MNGNIRSRPMNWNPNDHSKPFSPRPATHFPHQTGPSTSFPANAKTRSKTAVGTVSVVGLSGPEQEKGVLGVGKSTLCNRMVLLGVFYEKISLILRFDRTLWISARNISIAFLR